MLPPAAFRLLSTSPDRPNDSRALCSTSSQTWIQKCHTHISKTRDKTWFQSWSFNAQINTFKRIDLGKLMRLKRLYLRLHAEYVRIVLLKASHTCETSQGAGQLISMQHSKISESQRQFAPRTIAGGKHQAVSRAVHWFQRKFLLFSFELKHVFLKYFNQITFRIECSWKQHLPNNVANGPMSSRVWHCKHLV